MTGPSTHQVPEAAVEALAEMRWNEGRNPNADSPRWDELGVGCEDMKRRYRHEARDSLEEAAPFLLPALLSDEVVDRCWAEVFGEEPQPEDFIPELRAKERVREVLTGAIERVGGADIT